MKKKCIRFLPLLIACLLLCGCFLEPAEGLYAVPKQSEEYYDLQNAIELALPDGAVYAPPVSGDNQQVVQMVDLDGDGEDEAVVYCKTTGELPAKRCLHAGCIRAGRRQRVPPCLLCCVRRSARL